MIPGPEPRLPLCRHASEEEYMAFVERTYDKEDIRKLFRLSRSRFVRAYPDLAGWFAAPLEERIGRLHGAPANQYTDQASYEARQYLFFLALCGYATFDWEWLIPLPKIHLRPMLREAGFTSGVEQLIRTAEQLGYHPVSSSEDLRWVLSRILLHTRFLPLGQLSEVHCEELAQAIREFGQRADLTHFFPSAEHSHVGVEVAKLPYTAK